MPADEPDAPAPAPAPAYATENNYMNQFTNDDFKYSATRFDMDYLENLNSEANSDPSDLSRKSLFVKFDPLIDKESPRSDVPIKNEDQLVHNSIPNSKG